MCGFEGSVHIITMEELYKKLEECEQATRVKKASGRGRHTSAVPMEITTNEEESEQAWNDMIGVDSSQLEAHH